MQHCSALLCTAPSAGSLSGAASPGTSPPEHAESSVLCSRPHGLLPERVPGAPGKSPQGTNEALGPKFTWGHVIEMISFILLHFPNCSYRVQLTNKGFTQGEKKNKKFLQELVLPSCCVKILILISKYNTFFCRLKS